MAGRVFKFKKICFFIFQTDYFIWCECGKPNDEVGE